LVSILFAFGKPSYQLAYSTLFLARLSASIMVWKTLRAENFRDDIAKTIKEMLAMYEK
jgi:hypothetical protein